VRTGGRARKANPVRVENVVYLGSFADPGSLPRPVRPEIAFVGRSNVGKSSLINALLGRRGVARTSNTPGKTRTANFYVVNDAFCFVDMPGYGYARVSKEERSKWRALVVRYLTEREALRGVVHLLDVRHTPAKSDIELFDSLADAGRRCCLAFNKVDKLGRGSVRGKIAEHLRVLEPEPGTAVIAFSSETGEGKRELWSWITESMGEA
jgi:GTP-binding protein